MKSATLEVILWAVVAILGICIIGMREQISNLEVELSACQSIPTETCGCAIPVKNK